MFEGVCWVARLALIPLQQDATSVYCLQVTVLRSYDTMTATARRQPEGSLVYILDQTDLYLRVRDGLRQVQVGVYRYNEQNIKIMNIMNRNPLRIWFFSVD